MGLQTHKKIGGLIFPSILLIIAICTTLGLYFYNQYIVSENEKIDANISEISKSIKNVKKDPNLQIFNLITNNQKVIDTLIAGSQITRFIESMNQIENEYKIYLDGFNYSNGEIHTFATAASENGETAYRSVAYFIEQYRKDSQVDFTLPFVSQVEGSSKMKFNLKLHVKKSLPQKGAASDENDLTEKQKIGEVENKQKTVKERILEQNKKQEAAPNFTTEL